MYGAMMPRSLKIWIISPRPPTTSKPNIPARVSVSTRFMMAPPPARISTGLIAGYFFWNAFINGWL